MKLHQVIPHSENMKCNGIHFFLHIFVSLNYQTNLSKNDFLYLEIFVFEQYISRLQYSLIPF